MSDLKHRVLIMAGGTGGHVFPGLAVAHALIDAGVEVEWLGGGKGIENRLVPDAGILLHRLPTAGLRGKGLLAKLGGGIKAMKAVWQALRLLRERQPALVIGFGGYAAGPGGLAALLRNIPLFLHEQNAVPGTTNRLLAKRAKRVFSGFPVSIGEREAEWLGNPVRQTIAALAPPKQRFAGRKGELRILVLGGSLGAKAINECVPEALAAMSDKPQCWHQTGADHIESVKAQYKQRQVEAKVEPFIDDMAEALGWADLVICRAGALTVSELSCAGLGALLIPLPHAIDDHQTQNARWLTRNGGGEWWPQSQLSPRNLASYLSKLSREQCLLWAEAARSVAKPEAAQQLAAACTAQLMNTATKGALHD